MWWSLPSVAGRRLVVPQPVALPLAGPPPGLLPVVLLRPACSPARMPFRLRQRA
ncbi:MAG TPA: hypothetical protein PK472_03250 [Pseudomonadota bacterium]|nr:hypothetical protein [Pseudomonadota bacterium]